MVRRMESGLPGRQLGLLQLALTPKFDASNMIASIASWENTVREYASTSGEAIADSIKAAVLVMNAPGPVQTHLQVSGNDLRDYAMVKRTLEQYFMAQKVWTASPSQSTATGSSAMQIDALTKGKGKKGRNKSKDVKACLLYTSPSPRD